MLDQITKYQRSRPPSDVRFSVLIPTWNNLPYLQLCIRSIQSHSTLPIQIIVIVNEGKDGTLEWLRDETDFDFVHAQQNAGICYGLNAARSLVMSDYIIYINDDMYVLPDWDGKMWTNIQGLGTKMFMLSSTMIEPTTNGNKCTVVKDFGRDIESFKETELLENYTTLYRDDWSGSTWPPNVIHVDMWDLVGGFSIEFSPGMYSDPDLSMKLYKAGVRHFKGIGDSMVYHFGSRSTKRVRKNLGRKTFLFKWGITSRTFTTLFLKTGQKYEGALTTPKLAVTTKWINRLKRVLE
ncbi:MAG TPA: glycosyltransferase family 2 protein [Saprospiraceae bacterium]|nr:glycosyltransferase family 2 protein [Saprospiraceae bacterium]